MTDAAVLGALGERLARRRLERNLTQAQLAREAGVSLSTVGRLEAGESTQLTNLVRVLRALDLLAHFDELLPAPTPGPLEQLRGGGKPRQRASRPATPISSSIQAASFIPALMTPPWRKRSRLRTASLSRSARARSSKKPRAATSP